MFKRSVWGYDRHVLSIFLHSHFSIFTKNIRYKSEITIYLKRFFSVANGQFQVTLRHSIAPGIDLHPIGCSDAAC